MNGARRITVLSHRIINTVRILSMLGAGVSGWLVLSEIQTHGFCAYLFNIPACYIIIILFFVVYISTLNPIKFLFELLFWAGVIPGFFIAVWFSYHQFMNLSFCPALFSMPLCYASMITFGTLICLKIFIKVVEKNNSVGI